MSGKRNKSAPKKRVHGNSSEAGSTRERQATFLEAFAIYGNIVRTCSEIDIPRTTIDNWKDKDSEGEDLDPEFMKLYAIAKREAVKTMEAEAWRRGIEGELTPTTVAGERVDVHRKSDTLLIFLLKAHAPEKYRDRYDVNVAGTVKHTGQVHIYMPDNGRGPDGGS